MASYILKRLLLMLPTLLGVALLVIFGGQLGWFPLRGLTSGNFAELSVAGKVVDYLWHIALPVLALSLIHI